MCVFGGDQVEMRSNSELTPASAQTKKSKPQKHPPDLKPADLT